LKHSRFRWDPKKFSFLHQWRHSDFSCKDGDAGCDGRIRKDIRLRLYEVYKQHARIAVPDQTPACMTTFYATMGDGFVDQHSENCCCGQCVTGWNYLKMMLDFINDTSNGVKDYKARAQKMAEIKKFLDYDFR
jgi:hypothetical protein